MRVEIVFFAGCPNVEAVRRLVHRCMAACHVTVALVEIDTAAPGVAEHYRRFGSPTVLVDGEDVVGGGEHGESCRLDLPTEAQLVAALRTREDDGG